MTDSPSDGKRDHATHETQHDDPRLQALRDILIRLAHGVAQKIYMQPTPPQNNSTEPGTSEDTQA